jgi:acyl-coenzyme A thioesterase PaaI-like protein
LPAGTARASATLLHGGRSLSTVAVDVCDEAGKLATRGTVSLADSAGLKPLRIPSGEPDAWTAFDEAQPWPPVAPIVATLDARSVGSSARGLATGVRVPWEGDDFSAEAACLAADISVGQPIGATLTGAGEPPRAPNPDLSLRFCGEVRAAHVVGVSRTHRVDGGVMALSIEVWSQGELVAVGVSSALVLGEEISPRDRNRC